MAHVYAQEGDKNEPSPSSNPKNPQGAFSHPVSYDALKKSVSQTLTSQSALADQLSSEQIESLKAREALLRLVAEREAYDKYHALRQTWAKVLGNLLYGMVAFEVLLTLCVGLGWLHFPSQLFLNLVAGQTFLQIAGMCYLVVNFLFPNDKKGSNNSKPKKIKTPDKVTQKPEQTKTE